MAATFAGSKFSTKHVLVDDDEEEEQTEEDEEEDSAESGSTSSFSLQECIDEFRARRTRRVSTHSRDCENNHSNNQRNNREPRGRRTMDADLINQNRCNKEQERKGKPCQNGFCYCFTSDSGDCGSTAPPRDQHVRLPRRSRRSESSKATKQNNLGSQEKQAEKRRQSEPANVKSTHQSPLTAISRLRAVGGDGEPLIHIIQELRDNCVVSEVRVNREKLPVSTTNSCRHRNSQTLKATTSTKQLNYKPIAYEPSAPVLSNISEQESALEEEQEKEMLSAEPSSRRSSRSRRSSGGGGRLLQKRLSQSEAKYKARNAQQKPPPPKPPRCSSRSLDGTSLTSTNPSVREAERVLDEFLRKRGVCVPVSNVPKKDSQRRSYPMAEVEKPRKSPSKQQLPTCPSLSDIERVVESKRGSHYARNIRQESFSRKSGASKQIILGWTEPKITDMLNYEGKPKAKEFETHAAPAEPQVPIGWQLPKPKPQPVVPKVSLDTVDGSMSENLAANIEYKETPIKYPTLIKTTGGQASQKFIWGEQWRNLSPWKGQKSKKLGAKSKNFLNNSKNKILRFVSPKKSNQQEHRRMEEQQTPKQLCTVGVQTSNSQLDLQSQSPPGSYHSPMQTTPSGTTTSTRQQPYFDFERKVEAPTPPKKLPRANRARKLDFQTEATAAPTTYRSYQKDLDHDVTINKMGYLLSSIRAKLEASDERALRTFRDCSRSDPPVRIHRPTDSFDCTDGPASSLATTSVATTLRLNRRIDSEPIYSEIEEDCLQIRGSPHHEVKTAAHLNKPTSTTTSTPSSTVYVSESTPVPSPSPAELSAMYAQVQKTPKNSPQTKSQVVRTEVPVTKVVQRPVQPQALMVQPEVTTQAVQPQPKPPLALGHFLHESLKNGSFFQFMPLPEEPGSASESSCSASQSTESSVVRQPKLKSPPPLTHQSLNNISEKDSPPKKHRNLSRSELSLQRSEIFLDNLCRSELVLDRLEKVPNTCSHADSVSYDMPHEGHELYADYSLGEGSSSFATNDYGSGHIEPEPENQSTPKKRQQQSQRFTTKPSGNLSIDINDGPATPLRPFGHNLSLSCPTTPQQAEQALQAVEHSGFHNSTSLGELGQTTLPNNSSESQLMSVSALARYRLLKDAVRRSYRKGKNFIRAEKQRLAQSLNLSRDQSSQGEADSSSYYASFNLDSLLNESLTPSEQLAQAVSICRQMPELEISSEMVEAERLLLFSSLRKAAPLGSQTSEDAPLAAAVPVRSQCLLIDAMELPVRADVSLDMFFNYHFICTFESGGRIRSTQSVECQNGSAFFRDCGLEFYSDERSESLELRCQIFMLRLRKVSTLSLEPAKSLRRGSGNLGSCNSSSSAGSGTAEHIISRFRLHASFTLRAMDLAPFELVESETRAGDKICLRSSKTWKFPLTPHSKSTNLGPGISVTGRVDLRLPKIHFAGYLNVQDPRSRHHWNRRWCSLDGVHVSVWQHEHNLEDDAPLFSVELPGCGQSAITAAPRELCARARSFLVQGKQSEYESGVFFAADTQPELVEWLLHLNEALQFARHWLSAT